MNQDIPKRFSIENENWAIRTGGNIIAVIAEEDNSDGYDTEMKHLYGLDNGNFAVVHESGCSCYSMVDAHILLFKDQKEAQVYYDTL